jgi:hypothetical protein
MAVPLYLRVLINTEFINVSHRPLRLARLRLASNPPAKSQAAPCASSP